MVKAMVERAVDNHITKGFIPQLNNWKDYNFPMAKSIDGAGMTKRKQQKGLSKGAVVR